MATNSSAFINTADPDDISIEDNSNYPSIIKEFFSYLKHNIEKNRWSSKCRFCPLIITDTYKTTSNFVKHVKNKHQSLYDEWKNKNAESSKDKNQPKINHVFSPDREKYSTNNIRQQQLTNSIIQNLIINMALPLSIVNHVSFNNFMKNVDPKYKPIHRRDLTRSHIPVLHKKCISKLQAICSRSNHVSLTLDVWSDRRMRSYFGITMHTIIEDKHQSFLLSFERLQGQHTTDKLSTEFDRVVQLYNLNNNIVRLITDNASNNLAAFDNIVLPGFDD
ncbi:unnamed protein product [Adineta ricciae]|uniref:BED-type domain-containing protein n=1 Tax=Adineta ricciae TaxID=249248 RepID=A0A815G8E3_ADIRI|nr:unnamed protein product [Adineta ricciae]CAF1420593.1 unnamed protein product [Adineta ricciae]